VGTLSRGWFKQAGANLENLLTEDGQMAIRVYLLDPFGTIWRGLVASGTMRHSQFLDDAIEVFRTLYELSTVREKQFVVHLYDTEPMSFVMAKGTIYLGLYLPRTSRKDVPECTISEGSYLGQKVIESAKKLRDWAPLTNAAVIADYRRIMQEHVLHTREQFWSDPRVFCDFCKELRNLPCTFSRRHVDLAGKRAVRVAPDCCLLPSLGPLVHGHSLLLPAQHVTSLARLKAEAFTSVVTKADDWARKVPNGKIPLMFEHGTPTDETLHGGCGICHCHLHLLPMPIDSCQRCYERLAIFLKERGYESNFINLESWDALQTHAASAYIAVRIDAKPPRILLFGNDVPIQSQLLREFVASQLVHPARPWDWRDSKAIDLASEKKEIVETIEDLKGMFSC
jgi:diadenosine tetraphosphate (Ap4A) HIT family hydrolase